MLYGINGNAPADSGERARLLSHLGTERAPTNTARLQLPRAYKYRAPTNTARIQYRPRTYEYPALINTAHLQIPRTYKYINTAHL